MDLQNLKIYILGTGATGGYFGGLLAKSGLNVTFITKEKYLNDLNSKGLTLKSKDGEQTNFKIKAVAELSDETKADLIIITVKSFDTEEAAEQIKPIVKDSTIVLTIQNGIDNPEKIESIIGKSNVMHGYCAVAASVPEVGVIEHTHGMVHFGELDGKSSDRTELLENIFKFANVEYKVHENITLGRWKKFLANTSSNIVTAITNLETGRFFETPDSAQLIHDIMVEIAKVAEKEGVVLTEQNITDSMNITKSFGSFVTSTLQDVRKKKKLETEAFTGYVLKLGEKHGVDLPINKTLYALLKAIETDINSNQQILSSTRLI